MRALGGLIEKGIYHVDGLYAIQILLGRLVRLIAKGGLYVGLLYGRLGQPRLRSGVIFQAPAPPTTGPAVRIANIPSPCTTNNHPAVRTVEIL
jgi:hypothetical protein